MSIEVFNILLITIMCVLAIVFGINIRKSEKISVRKGLFIIAGLVLCFAIIIFIFNFVFSQGTKNNTPSSSKQYTILEESDDGGIYYYNDDHQQVKYHNKNRLDLMYQPTNKENSLYNYRYNWGFLYKDKLIYIFGNSK